MLRYMLFVLLCGPLLAQSTEQTDVAAGQPDKYGVIQKRVYADTPATFAEQSQRIREDMQTGGRYEYITATDKRSVDRLLEQMAALLDRAGSVDAMNHDTRIQLFNAQEEVNGILKHNDSNRLVCESRAPIGSNILRTTCRTHGQIEATARNTKEGLMEFDHSRLCNGSGPDGAPCLPNLNQPRAQGH
jgi:hypothetical protein